MKFKTFKYIIKVEKRCISLEFIDKKCKAHMIMMIVMFYVQNYNGSKTL